MPLDIARKARTTEHVRAVSCRPGADGGGGGRQEREGQADGVIRADGEEVFEDDRERVKINASDPTLL